MRTTATYTTADGRAFTDKDKAIQWEQILVNHLANFLKREGITNHLYQASVAHAIVEHFHKIQETINFPKRRKQQIDDGDWG